MLEQKQIDRERLTRDLAEVATVIAEVGPRTVPTQYAPMARAAAVFLTRNIYEICREVVAELDDADLCALLKLVDREVSAARGEYDGPVIVWPDERAAIAKLLEAIGH